MSTLYDCTDPDQRASGLRHAMDALGRGELVVLPTDTVYGVAADAFDPVAVASLLAAKGRGRSMPPPVLVHDQRSMDGLVADATDAARALVDAFWPGGLTVVCWAQPSLRWDLGDTGGTVALRVPDDELARELLRATGPLAVSSANATGRPAGRTAADAREMLGTGVACYLDDGPRDSREASTIVDVTKERPVVLRLGAVGLEELRGVVPDVRGPASQATSPAQEPAPAPDAAPAEAPRAEEP